MHLGLGVSKGASLWKFTCFKIFINVGFKRKKKFPLVQLWWIMLESTHQSFQSAPDMFRQIACCSNWYNKEKKMFDPYTSSKTTSWNYNMQDTLVACILNNKSWFFFPLQK